MELLGDTEAYLSENHSNWGTLLFSMKDKRVENAYLKI